MKTISIILLLSMLFFKSYADTPTSEEEIKISQVRFFKGEALYGFMNGGSDLFLEYGFQELQVLDLTYRDEKFTIELYTMASPEDAFGIYSLHTFKCIACDTLNQYDCHSKYQLQTIKGNTYISIVFGKPTKGVKREAIELLHHFTQNIEDIPFKIPKELESIDPPLSGKLKYMKGAVSATTDITHFLPLLQVGTYELWHYKPTPQEKGRLLIKVDTQEQYTILKEKISGENRFYDESQSILIAL